MSNRFEEPKIEKTEFEAVAYLYTNSNQQVVNNAMPLPGVSQSGNNKNSHKNSNRNSHKNSHKNSH